MPIRVSNRKFFGLHKKVKLPQPIYACIFVVITLWQQDFMMKQIFFSSLFLFENTGRLVSRLATQATITGTPGSFHFQTIVSYFENSIYLCTFGSKKSVYNFVSITYYLKVLNFVWYVSKNIITNNKTAPKYSLYILRYSQLKPVLWYRQPL